MSENIILIGPMGAGKTTIGKKLAAHLGRSFVDVDEAIEQHLGVSIQTIFDTEGEAGFREREKQMLETIATEQSQTVIATGGGCVLTAACRKIIMRQRLVVHIDVSLKQQQRRLRSDKKRPILQNGNLAEKLQQLREQRHDIYQGLADVYLMTDQQSYRHMLQTIEKHLNA